MRKPELVLPGWQALPWEAEGKRAVPQDGDMTLSSLSLGPKHDVVGAEVRPAVRSQLLSAQTPVLYLKAPPIPALPHSSC